MKLVRISTIVAFAAAVTSGTVLFVTSQRVQRAEHHLAALKEEKTKQQDTIHVLTAEWDYLNRPDRLEALATRYLAMKAPDIKSITTDAKTLDNPAEWVADAHKAVMALKIQPAAFHQPPPIVAPVPPKPPGDSGDQHFKDMLHNLNEGAGQ